MKIALAQIDSHENDVQINLEKHLDYIHKAEQAGADLIVFPELSLTGDEIGPVVPDVGLLPEDQPVQRLAAASKSIDIVVGLNEKSHDNLYNRYNSAFYFAAGALIHRHRKLMLVNYSVFDEAKHYVPGYNLEAFDTMHGRFCMLVCNDMWHGGLPYLAALDGAEVVISPANSARGTLQEKLDIPTTWENINRTHSATTGVYTIFVNRAGIRRSIYGNFTYWGGSEIIGPQGEVVVKAPYDDEALVFGEIDVQAVATQRFTVPIIRDARLHVIGREIKRMTHDRDEAARLEDVPIADTSYPPHTHGM